MKQSTRTLFQTEAERRLSTRNLKCCPLCNAINARQNGSCFVCSWQGMFVNDANVIERGLLELLDKCPELAGAVFKPVSPVRLTLRQRLLAMFRRKVDLWA